MASQGHRAGSSAGDGFVGIDDLNAVLGNWNAGTPPQLPGAGANIPEPATAVLLLYSVTLLTKRRTLRS